MRLIKHILKDGKKMAKRNSTLGRTHVLGFLKKGLKLNALVAQREFGCVGSTLAFFIFQLRQEGWDITTKMKTGHKGSRYAEYTLSPNWRLVGEEEKRMEIAMNAVTAKMGLKEFSLTDFVIGDRISTKLDDEVVTVIGVLDKGCPLQTPLGAIQVPVAHLIIAKDDGESFMNLTLDNVIKKEK
jgi:hypothetical protein